MGDVRSNVRRALTGIVAALLAVSLAVLQLVRYQAAAQRLADQWAHDLAPANVPVKEQTLTLQRAGFAEPDLLPIYGSSELYCCGLPFNGPVFFWHEPTGFELYAVGEAVTGDLYFAESFAALGHALRGKRVVISDSPWFLNPNGIGQAEYNHTFSPEVAAVFAFDSPIPLPLRQSIARRMLTYPGSLQGLPILSRGLHLLAGGSPADVMGYELLDPLGRLDAWVAQLHDAQQTFAAIASFRRKGWRPNVVDDPHVVDWHSELTQADRLSQAAATADPFGIASSVWAKCTDVEPTQGCAQALALYRSGRSNRGGGAYPYPASWVGSTETSAEWTDLQLELEVLRALGARPFAYLMPLQGRYDDYTPLSAAVRQVMYARYAAVTAAAGVPSTTFAVHDEDPYFAGSFGHLTPRGWLYVDRTLDLFWHGQLGLIRPALASGGSVEQLLDDPQTYAPLAPPIAPGCGAPGAGTVEVAAAAGPPSCGMTGAAKVQRLGAVTHPGTYPTSTST